MVDGFAFGQPSADTENNFLQGLAVTAMGIGSVRVTAKLVLTDLNTEVQPCSQTKFYVNSDS